MMRTRWFVLSVFIILSACSGKNKKSINLSKDTVFVKHRSVAKPMSALERKYIDAGLVDVHQFDTSIRVLLKYATSDNFVKCNVYGSLEKAYTQKDVAEMLAKAQKYLNEKKQGYHLIIFDATRPMSVQKKMWDTLKMPAYEKIKYLSNPAYGGGLHNYGVAVDLSIVDDKEKELDMGTPFDFMGELASPQCEAKMLSTRKLTQQQIDNRKLLRSIMNKAGFYAIPYEWWHFNLCAIQTAQSKYKVIE